jgi:hypothetical protein
MQNIKGENKPGTGLRYQYEFMIICVDGDPQKQL